MFESLEEDEECPEYAGLFKRFVADTNAYAQQRGLEAVKAFLKNGSLTPEYDTFHLDLNDRPNFFTTLKYLFE